MKIKLGVIFGGESVEHEVSIISAVQAMNKMDSEKYEIIPIYIAKDRKWYTGEFLRDMETYQDMNLMKRYAKEVALINKDGRFVLVTKGFISREVKEVDIVFPIVHGTNVEDGVLQGYLTTIGVPFVGVDTYSAVVGQDKVFMKDIFISNDLPVCNYVWFYDSEYEEDNNAVIKKVKDKLKYPVIVKPATSGSSIGIKAAKDDEELKDAIIDAIQYDKKIVVEEMVKNLKEVNISLIGNYEGYKVSAIEEVFSKSDLLTFEEKYIGNGKVKGKLGVKAGSVKSKGMVNASRKIPADIDDKMKDKIEEIARCALKCLGSSGVVRIDFMIDTKAKKVYINEVNSIPGSLSFYLWEPTGLNYTNMLDEVINIGIKDYKKKGTKTRIFKSNILSGFTSFGGLKGMKGKKF